MWKAPDAGSGKGERLFESGMPDEQENQAHLPALPGGDGIGG
jgi:hypothetical protein